MTAHLLGNGTTRLMKFLTTILQSLKKQEVIFLWRLSLDVSPRSKL